MTTPRAPDTFCDGRRRAIPDPFGELSGALTRGSIAPCSLRDDRQLVPKPANRSIAEPPAGANEGEDPPTTEEPEDPPRLMPVVHRISLSEERSEAGYPKDVHRFAWSESRHAIPGFFLIEGDASLHGDSGDHRARRLGD